MKSALIQFSVGNFLSFKERIDFSMVARGSSQEKLKENCPFFQTGKDGHNLHVFKSSFIFGGNASGKSNLLKAIRYMDMKIEKSHDSAFRAGLKQKPYLLDFFTQKQPSFFEIVFSTEKRIYRYNFEILDEEIISENLWIIGTKEEKQILKRDCQNIELFYEFDNKNAHDIKDEKTDTHVLFISAAQNWKEGIAIDVGGFFKTSLNAIDVMNQSGRFTTKRMRDDSDFKNKILFHLQKTDFHIKDMSVIEEELPAEIIEKFPQFKNERNQNIQFLHEVYKDGMVVENKWFDEEMESQGTRTLLNILGPIIDTLDRGAILTVDELNSSLHPNLCSYITELFHSKEYNPNNAQFIVVTHDTSLLSNSDINRNQFWFTERNKYGSSTLYSLEEFKKENRNGEDYQKRYLNGRFGAVPFIQK